MKEEGKWSRRIGIQGAWGVHPEGKAGIEDEMRAETWRTTGGGGGGEVTCFIVCGRDGVRLQTGGLEG